MEASNVEHLFSRPRGKNLLFRPKDLQILKAEGAHTENTPRPIPGRWQNLRWLKFNKELNICSISNSLGAYFMPGHVLDLRDTEMKDHWGNSKHNDHLV